MGKDTKRHQKKKKSHKPVKKERNNNHSKDKDLGVHGIRVGYHSEAAKMPEHEETEGMKVGYHSEAANPSTHRARLHTREQEDTEAAEEDRDKGPT